MLIMKNGKRQMTEGIKLPNQETLDYFWILEADSIKQAEMKEKN